jgi:hypothetical protein
MISPKTAEIFITFQRRQSNKATPHKTCEATAYNARQFQYTPTQHESVPHPRCSQPATKYSRKCSGTSTAELQTDTEYPNAPRNMLGSSRRHIVPNSSAWLCESFHWILKPQILGKCPEWRAIVWGGTCLPHARRVRGQDAPILEWSPHLPTWNGGRIRFSLLARYSQGTAPNSYRPIHFYEVLPKEYRHFWLYV